MTWENNTNLEKQCNYKNSLVLKQRCCHPLVSLQFTTVFVANLLCYNVGIEPFPIRAARLGKHALQLMSSAGGGGAKRRGRIKISCSALL